MAIPISKTELLSAITVTFNRLSADLARIPESRAYECSMPGHAAGTLMSPANLVSYLLDWTELVLKWLHLDDQHIAANFPETGYKWNQLGLLAQKFYADYSGVIWVELIGRLETVKIQRTDTITHRSDDELYGAPWYNQEIKGRMIQFNTSSPYANARTRIRKWLI